MNITYVYADSKEEWNCSEWRCAIPARAINRHGRHVARLLDIQSFANNTPEAQSVCSGSDLIVIQRNLFGPVLPAIQRWKARDKVVIADFDDAYDLIPPQVKNYEFWMDGLIPHEKPDQTIEWVHINPPPITQFKWGLRLAHAATVPSNVLVEDWCSYTNMINIPNYIELERYSSITPQPHSGIIIGWGGSLSHLQSFQNSGLVAALNRVCRARPRVKVLICGDRRVYDQLSLPPSQMIFQPWVSADDWPKVLANFDIGLAPLFGPYDDRRSWIKVLEYMVMKIPWIATDSPAYRQLRSYGWLVQNTESSWERVLLDMIDHLQEHQAEAKGEPFLFALSQNIDENVETILSTYGSIASKVYGPQTQFCL